MTWWLIAIVHQAAASPERFSAVGLADAIRRRSSVATVRLTTRESEVLRELAAGASVAQIARALYMSESTVKTHIAKLYDKLGANNRASAVMSAMRLGLIPAPMIRMTAGPRMTTKIDGKMHRSTGKMIFTGTF